MSHQTYTSLTVTGSAEVQSKLHLQDTEKI